MIHIDKSKQQKIHSRKIDVAVYEGTSDSIIIEGTLKDERMLDSYRPAGEVLPPGTVHHMIIRLKVSFSGMVIEDVDVEMPTVPGEECRETRNSLLPIIGISIVTGFTLKAKDLVGGTKGCSHLLALLNTMAPAAVQGVWSATTREPVDPALYLPMAMKKLGDTCYAWRTDGAIMKKCKSML